MVDEEFVPYLDDMNDIAIGCDVIVWVTHAYRKEGQNIGGTVVPPASNSNHLVGHAIDINLDTPRGWCNGACLESEINTHAKCFTDAIEAHGPGI